MRKSGFILLCLLFYMSGFAQEAFGMHIMEGFLPPKWCGLWILAVIPFLFRGYFSIQKTIALNPKLKLLLALAGAFTFVLSALKIPSVTGSCSHPTGIGFGAIIFGPSAMSLIGIMVLLFQALLLAHGGLTTIGANTFSMAVAGPFIAFVSFKIVRTCKGPRWLAIFMAAFLGDLVTYVTTALQLALAFPAENGGFVFSCEKFMAIFAVTQIPLAISEGILTVLIFNAIFSLYKDEFKDIPLFGKEE